MVQIAFTCLVIMAVHAHANPTTSRSEAAKDLKVEESQNERKGTKRSYPSNDVSGFLNLNGPVLDQDRAKEEPAFKAYEAYDNLQNVLIKLFNPKPIVDTIEEHEKFGNDGSRHEVIGTAVVRGSEAVAKLINAALDAPKLAVRKVSQGATEILNQIGGKIVGL